MVLVEELEFARAPRGHMVAETIVGPALIRHGTPAQKSLHLPQILRGERTFALGYSESVAGSDLAALRTRAVREADIWILNGEKLWSTGGDKAQAVWLAARTDPETKFKQAGISVFIVPLDAVGITIRPSMAMYGKTFSAINLVDVRVPHEALIGEVHGGWQVITAALAAERVMIGGLVALLQRTLHQLTDYLRATGAGRQLLTDNPAIRDRIGALGADIEVARQLALRNALLISKGKSPIYEAAMTKLFAGELHERLAEAALDILGTGGLLSVRSGCAPVGEIEQVLRHSIMSMLGGGTGEIQRNIIATKGIGLPR
jgi:alkylation response protein AidB-like acyl-CoA dehydrogenase